MTAHLSPPEPGRAPIFPWAEWLNGQTWTLVRGRDYWDDNAKMRRRTQSAANARRVKVLIDGSNPKFLRVKAAAVEWEQAGIGGKKVSDA
jgi:hypothetical protein